MFGRVRSRRDAYGRSFRSPAFLAVVAGVVVASLLVAFVLRQTWLHEIDQGRERAAMVAHVVEEHTVRNLTALDFVLQGVVEAARSPTLPENDAAFREALKERLRQLPAARALFVIGADGFITHDTDYPATPRVSLADREYFRKHREDPDAGLHVGPPLLSRSVDRWFVSVSRHIARPDGSFGGVAVVAVEPAYYDGLYTELKLAPTDIVGLLYRDGSLIARVPKNPALVGTVRPGLDRFTAYAAAQGTYTSADFDDGVTRTVSFRSVAGYPLVVVAALGRNALLANWRTTTAMAAASFALLAALALATTLVLIRRRIEHYEARRRAAAAERLQTLGQMTGGVAHDFNNLIAAIGAGLVLAEKNAVDPEKLRACLGATRDAAERATGLARQLLAFAKRQQLEVTSADINLLLRRLVPMLEQAAGAGVKLTLDLAADLWPCRLDQAQFDVAVLNLVINARDAMLPKGGRIVIATANWTEPETSPTLRPGPYVRLTVRDTGPGIPKQLLDKVFEPFFSTKGEGGTGLGLSQVYGAMQQLGGTARVWSRPGKGATVELVFPCAGEDEYAAAAPTERSLPAEAAPPLANPSSMGLLSRRGSDPDPDYAGDLSTPPKRADSAEDVSRAGPS